MTTIEEAERIFSELDPTLTPSTLVAEWPNFAVGATYLSSNDPREVMTIHVDPRNRPAISCDLGDVPAFEDWAGGRHSVYPGERRTAPNIFDLNVSRVCDFHGRFDGLFSYTPYVALNDVAGGANTIASRSSAARGLLPAHLTMIPGERT